MSRSVNKLKSFRFRLAFNFYLAAFLIIMAAVLSYNYFFKNELNQHVGREITSITQIASTLINPEDFKQLRTQADEGTDKYRRIRRTLQDIKRANPDILFIYTMRPTSDKNTYEFVVDADKKPYHIGEKYDVSGQLTIREALKQPVLEEEYEENQWGTYLTGYAPIKNTAGETVGIVGIDYGISSQKDTQQIKIITAAFITVFLGIVITTWFVFRRNARLINPFKQVTAGITKISEGNFDYRLNVRTGDEWELIAGLVNTLADKMVFERVKSQENLEIAEEQKDRVLQVYSDVISSATHGRFKLIDHSQAEQLSLEGVLYSEAQLTNNTNVDNEINLVRKLFAEKELPEEKGDRASGCISYGIENVLKHAGSGFIHLRALDDVVRIIIADSGKGIDFQKLPDILFAKNHEQSSGGIRYLTEHADVTHMATSSEGTVLVLDFTA